MTNSAKTTAVVLLTLLSGSGCQSQNNKPMENNPLLCNPEKGLCEIPGTPTQNSTTAVQAVEKPIKVVYFTDPICSSCWGIEPQLRKLKLEYGQSIDIEYRMGGLLPDWSYNSGGISKPSDVAHHWDEVSAYYDMPIDGDVWLEDPLDSSYPPSIAFKAAQLQDQQKALLFLREIREMVFLQKKNIAKRDNLELAARKVGLDIARFKTDFEGRAKLLFEEDLKLGRAMGVRGFPTMIFSNTDGKTATVYGSKPYGDYEQAIKSLHPLAAKATYDQNWQAVFAKYTTLTAREFAELTQTPRANAEKTLNELTANGALEKQSTKNGSIWKRR